MTQKDNTILSTKALNQWQGSLTLFNGFKGTTPKDEIQNGSWEKIAHTVCENKPTITADKTKGQYFIPCLLKNAELVGETLKTAQKMGQPLIGKMRSKTHVTEASMLVVDIDGLGEEIVDAGLNKMKTDQITFLIYSSYSNGNPNKPGKRVRIIVPIDRPVGSEEYRQAYFGFDQHYFDAAITKADPSGSHIYQQQGVWMTASDWQDHAFKEENLAGVASAEALIALAPSVTQTPVKSKDTQQKQYPVSNADIVAARCQQIRAFRDHKGAGQSEPIWLDCLGVIVHCENGQKTCHDWSSAHAGYSQTETDRKLSQRLAFGPTTCDQFKNTNPDGCVGCQETCRSPITLGWADLKAEPTKSEKPQVLGFMEEIEPWHEEVNLNALLNTIVDLIKKHIVISDEQALIVALWILMTWTIEYAEVLPLLIITAPEKACGKTQLLDIVSKISARSLAISGITPAAMFRCIEQYKPTLLIDEADTFLREKQELTGLINAGHSRTSSFVIRSTGDNHEPKPFSVWCPKVLAGIALDQHLKDTTMSRGVIISMRRKLPEESVQRLRRTDKSIFTELRRQCSRFALDQGPMLAKTHPELPDQLNDRDQDNYEPLLAIAELAGSAWLIKATQAALFLSARDSDESTSIQLLMAIRLEFELSKKAKISTTTLIEILCKDEEATWSTYSRDKPITPRQLGKILNQFGIQSRTTKFDGISLKGYFREDFKDAFSRYLPPLPENLPSPRNSPLEAAPAVESTSTDNDITTISPSVAVPNPPALACLDNNEEAF